MVSLLALAYSAGVIPYSSTWARTAAAPLAKWSPIVDTNRRDQLHCVDLYQ